MIAVLDPAGHASVQDPGRAGHRRIGVGTSGAMDRLALATANLLLGNPADAAGIEVPGVPMRIAFLADTAFALTGADTGATLAGRPLPTDWRGFARAGEELALGHARCGVFAYLAVAGGIDVPAVLGSRSTHLRGVFGGHEGRTLKAGDLLATGPAPQERRCFGIVAAEEALPLPPDPDGATPVRVLPAAEREAYDDASREAFTTSAWRISAQSNRAGYRLLGPTLRLAEPVEMRSHGLVPGVIQGPAGGTPIIQLADAYTAGGYPKIGVVIEPDLWRVARTPLGGTLRFRFVSHAEALAAHDELAGHLARIRMLVEAAGSLPEDPAVTA